MSSQNYVLLLEMVVVVYKLVGKTFLLCLLMFISVATPGMSRREHPRRILINFQSIISERLMTVRNLRKE